MRPLGDSNRPAGGTRRHASMHTGWGAKWQIRRCGAVTGDPQGGRGGSGQCAADSSVRQTSQETQSLPILLLHLIPDVMKQPLSRAGCEGCMDYVPSDLAPNPARTCAHQPFPATGHGAEHGPCARLSECASFLNRA